PAGPIRRCRWLGCERAVSWPRSARRKREGGRDESSKSWCLMYRSRLVPRLIPVIGLIGAPLLIAAVFAILFGGIGQYSHWAALAALPVAAWELSLGVWLVVKGFKTSPITTGIAAATPTAHQDVAV